MINWWLGVGGRVVNSSLTPTRTSRLASTTLVQIDIVIIGVSTILQGRLCLMGQSSRLDPVRFVVCLECPILYLFVNGLGGFDKGGVNVVGSFGGCFEKHESILVGEFLSFGGGDFASLFQVLFVANEKNGHFGLGVLFDFFEPLV